MCLRCKSLMGCSKNGCTHTVTPKESVAELLARSYTNRSERIGGLNQSYRDLCRRGVDSLNGPSV